MRTPTTATKVKTFSTRGLAKSAVASAEIDEKAIESSAIAKFNWRSAGEPLKKFKLAFLDLIQINGIYASPPNS